MVLIDDAKHSETFSDCLLPSCPSAVRGFIHLSDSAVWLVCFIFESHFAYVSFFFLSSVPLPRFLTPALLPELVTNAPPPRLAGHLYFMLNCVITFNPIPFLFCFLSQMRMPVSESVRRHMGTRSSVLSSRGRRKAGGGGEEAGVWVDLPLPSLLPSSLPSERHLLVEPSLAKARGKEIKLRCLVWAERMHHLYPAGMK